MIVIFGQRWTTTPFGQAEISCPQCGKVTYHTAQHRSGKFTLFFLPILPLHGRYHVVCNVCGYRRRALGMLRAQLEGLHRTGSMPPGLTLQDIGKPICPKCGHQGKPTVEKRISTGAWISSGCLLVLCCLPFFWIPLVMESLKDEIYRCSNCGTDLSTAQPHPDGGGGQVNGGEQRSG